MEQTEETTKTPTIEQAVEQSQIKQEPPKKEREPLKTIFHKDVVFPLSLNDLSIIQQALAPVVYANSILNVAKEKAITNPNNLVAIYPEDVNYKEVKDNQGNVIDVQIESFKDPEGFWNKNQMLKGNAMKIQNGELKSN